MFRALLVIAVAVLCMSGCRPWQQAEQVLHTTDSLDAQGVIYRDTAAFQSVILTYDRPIVRCLKHSDLGKAYYYLGRNYEDYHQRYLSAAKCYTRSDQCHISDPIMRGRVSSCMAYMCSLSGEHTLALDFAQKALDCYEHTENSGYYIDGLLNIVQLFSNAQMYNSVDSLLSIVYTFALDSNTLTRFYEQKGYYYYDLQQYDSALQSFHRSLNVLVCNPNKFYTLHCIMEAHFLLQHMDSAANYAHFVLQSTHSLLRANACYVLMEDAEQRGDAEAVAEYAHLRADLQKEVGSTRSDREEGAKYIKQYNAHQSNIGTRALLIFIGIAFAISVLFAIAYTYYKRLTRARKEATHRTQEMHQHHVKTTEKLEKQLDLFAEYMEQHDEVWADDAAFLNTINLYLWNMADTLRASYHLSVQDIKICVMTLLNMSRKEMAAKLFRAESSIPQMRARVAKKAGVSTQELRDFLIKQLTD